MCTQSSSSLLSRKAGSLGERSLAQHRAVSSGRGWRRWQPQPALLAPWLEGHTVGRRGPLLLAVSQGSDPHPLLTACAHEQVLPGVPCLQQELCASPRRAHSCLARSVRCSRRQQLSPPRSHSGTRALLRFERLSVQFSVRGLRSVSACCCLLPPYLLLLPSLLPG